MMKQEKKIGQQIDQFLRVPLYLIILFVVMTAVCFGMESSYGLPMAVVTMCYGITMVILYYRSGPKLTNNLINYIFEQGQIQKHLLKELSIPYVLVDWEGRLLWANHEFENMVGKEFSNRRLIKQIFPELTRDVFPKNEDRIHVNVEFLASNYRVELKRIVVDELIQEENSAQAIKANSMTALYFYDETALMAYKEECENQKMIAGLIYIDNYEEVLESIEEVRRPLMVALVERKITKYMQNIDGLVKKFEKDKYIVVFQNKYIHALQENKFSILDEVRSINVGNEHSVTLSIGIGLGGSTYIESYENARAAMDLALGRGGDQAVIKDGDQKYYYGGKTQTVEKTTRVKARVKAQVLREIIQSKDRVFVMGHKNPDADSLGAAIGIYRLAKTLGKNAHIVLNEVTSAIRPITDSLNAVPGIYGEDMFITNEKAMSLKDSSTMLVVVDVNKPALTECEELLSHISTIVVLDHHRQGGETIKNAVLSYIEPYASSSCEMVTEILQYIVDKPKLKGAEADALYAGMLVDTDNFVSKTGVRTFEAAAYLRRSGADVIRVRKLFREDMEQYKLRAEVVRKAEMYLGEFAIAVCPNETTCNPVVLGAQVANELLDIQGVRASFVLTQLKDKINISARSLDNPNVQIIMEKLGGGGHINMAATQLYDTTMQDALDILKNLLQTMKNEGDL